MPTVLETTRQEWQEGHRRLQAGGRRPPALPRAARGGDIVLEELRRRVGRTFTLDELAAAYAESDRWAQEAARRARAARRLADPA